MVNAACAVRQARRFLLEHDVILAAGSALLLIHTLGILSAIHAVAGVRTPQGAIAWAVSLVTFPYLALPLYWSFGRDRFQGYLDPLCALTLAGADQRVAGVRRTLESVRAELPAERAAELDVLAQLGGTPFTSGNVPTLLVDGDATFAAIFAAIESAARCCLVQFFIVKDDDLGRRLQALLVRKAAAGVRVYLLYDEIGSHGLPPSLPCPVARRRGRGVGLPQHPWSAQPLPAYAFLAAADRTGIQIYRYQDGFTHQKVVLVDDAVSSIGSANLDNRSLRLNFEITAIVVDRGLAAAVHEMLEEDFRRARRAGAADLTQRG